MGQSTRHPTAMIPDTARNTALRTTPGGWRVPTAHVWRAQFIVAEAPGRIPRQIGRCFRDGPLAGGTDVANRFAK